MDVSVVAAIGSFVMSERVLRPKATILVILGCVLAYDLTTKTHDGASLRVYRGPALVAFTLMCSAYSLRTWRRNGVACDELLFLPGTPHGERHASGTGTGGNSTHGSGASTAPETHETKRLVPVGEKKKKQLGGGGGDKVVRSNEGDAAAGFGQNSEHGPGAGAGRRCQSLVEHEMVPILASAAASATTPGSLSCPNSFDAEDNNETSATAKVVNNGKAATDGSGEGNAVGGDGNRGVDEEDVISDFESWNDDDDECQSSNVDDEEEEGEEENAVMQTLLCRSPKRPRANSEQHHQHQKQLDEEIGGAVKMMNETEGGGDNHANHGEDNSSQNGDAQQQQPQSQLGSRRRGRIRRIGTFFFFRSNSSPNNPDVSTYAPSGPSVFGAALDLSMPILFNFHLFIEATNHPLGVNSGGDNVPGGDMPARILPLIFLSVLMVRSVVPPTRRRRFWSTIKFTAMAPFHRVSFRDAFIGDVLTSLVRPVQDILFALFYYVTVIWGTAAGSYGMKEAIKFLEGSWLLHNVVLPSCAMLPLWWKFLQTLRQSYDEGQRWPHYGNAFKYLSAALVIVYGMAHPEDRRSKWWIISFVLATLYQIWWDTVMDWELFVITPKGMLLSSGGSLPPSPTGTTSAGGGCAGSCCNVSSFPPTSVVLLPIQRYIVQPVMDLSRHLYNRLPSYDQIHLRSKRLYKTEEFYWKVFVVNACLRFTWMMSFIPGYYIAQGEVVRTFSGDVNSYVGVAIAAAEIIRRCLWGLLKVEVETIKLTADRENNNNNNNCPYEDDEEDCNGGVALLESSHDDGGKLHDSSSSLSQYIPVWLDVQQKQQHDAATLRGSCCGNAVATRSIFTCSDSFARKLFVLELGLWAVGFIGFGIVTVSAQ